jgi:hypothetical protein
MFKNIYQFQSVSLVSALLLLLFSNLAQAHHVLGRPSYSLSEDSTTPPGTQIESSVGGYYTTYMVFPAFPVPNEPGRINLYVSGIADGAPYQGNVTFKIIDKSWFSTEESVLGVQGSDDNVFRQGFEAEVDGEFTVRAEFEADGKLNQIDFPLQIGEPSSFGPIGLTISIILLIIFGVNITQRKKLTSAKIKSAHGSASN